MKYLFRLSLLCLFIAGVFTNPLTAQVVVSSTTTTPTADGSAVLELQSPDMGILIPKFVLNDLTTPAPVAAPAEGLLIYNIGGATAEVEGFYFWANGEWNEVINDKRVFANEQFGELYEIAPAGTPTLVELTDKTLWYGWVSATNGTLSPGITTNTTHAFSDKMFISKYGLYNIQLSMSFGGSQNQQITSAVFVVNGSETETRIKVLSKISSAGDLISGSSIGVLELFPGDTLDLRFQSTNNGEDLFIYSINYIVTKVGE